MGKLTKLSKYLTVVFDVRGSRTYPDKNVLRNKLLSMCNQLNFKYQKYLKMEFKLKDGDSVMGVVSSFHLGFIVYREVRKLAWKHELNLYYGLGFGTIDTGNVTDANEINGSSVINAFSAVDFAKKDKLQENNHVRFFAYDDLEIIPYKAINSLVYVIYNEFSGKTAKQRELFKLMELNDDDMTQEEIGKLMGYDKNSRENISKLLARSNYELYKSFQKDLIDFLRKLQRILR